MANFSGTPYAERTFSLDGLNGISPEQVDQHLKLYAGYVKNTNTLNEQIAELVKGGDTASPRFGLRIVPAREKCRSTSHAMRSLIQIEAGCGVWPNCHSALVA